VDPERERSLYGTLTRSRGRFTGTNADDEIVKPHIYGSELSSSRGADSATF
jgi:hypothetical protein